MIFFPSRCTPEELIARVRSLMRLSEARHALEEARLAREIEQRQWIHRMFERYVSPKLVKEILDQGDRKGKSARSHVAFGSCCVVRRHAWIYQHCGKTRAEQSSGIA